MSTDAQAADSSPAPSAPVDPSTYLSTLSRDDYATWERTGTLPGTPEKTDPTPSADPSSAPVETTPADSSPAPAADAAKPRKTAEDRKRELAADIEADLRRRAEIREEIRREEARLRTLRQPTPEKTDAPPDSSPAPVSPAKLTYPQPLTSYEAFLETNPDATYDDYADARSDHRYEQRKAQDQAAERERAEVTTRTRAIQERDTKYQERVKAVIETDPDFIANLSPDVRGLKPFDAIRDAKGRWTEQPTGYHGIAESILDSPVAPQLMRHFTDHPDDLHRIAKLLPAPLLREMGKLESRYEKGAPAPAAPTPDPVTKAPAPPTTLGSRPAEPADTVTGAVTRGDFAAFDAEMTRREVAARRR